ncbi:threonine--tRNA ligase [Patescibacteria group bacterium]|nr:threonine--tRNA ligase [Patescibacteria group bacterium]
MKAQKLDDLRHSCAHLLAAAVVDLWPHAKRTIGPPIENGFYYDFDFGKTKVTEADFPKIEKKMRQLLPTWKGFERQDVSSREAKKAFKGNEYKLELIDEFSKEGQQLTWYQSGDYIDLCRGGHVDQPDKTLKHFKLLSVAGAYWRGDENNPMLTRIYGTCFPSKKELDAHLKMLEEAKKRDHRKLGKELDLFSFSDLVGPGLPLWTPRGTIMRDILDDFVWQLRKARGYQKVEIPHITKKDLYEVSGHWEKFGDDLFKITTREGHLFALKPMNCPHHTQIYAHRQWSYRDMPQRYSNTTMCYRDEQTGELSGLARLRSFTQDDAHVFCRQSQVKEEAFKIWDMIETFYGAFGFELSIRLSTHDPENMDAYIGDLETWKNAVSEFKSWLKERGVDYFVAVGEAAFYGPKIDFIATDSIGRQWQVATIQLDHNTPERFDLTCVNEDGKDERIVMLHAAIMGSIERFMSIMIEHYAGAFPMWLAPEQIRIVPVGEDFVEFGQALKQKLLDAGLRSEIDESAEKVGKKIRTAAVQKVPWTIVVGEKEVTGGDFTINVFGKEKDLVVKQDQLIKRAKLAAKMPW